MFTKAIQVRVIRKRGSEADIFLCENERCSRRIEQYFAIASAGNSEGERILFPCELQLRVSARYRVCCVWSLEDVLRHLVCNAICILDLDVQACR